MTEPAPRATSAFARYGAWLHVVFVLAVAAWVASITRWDTTTHSVVLGVFLVAWSAAGLAALARRRIAMRLALCLSAIVLAPLLWMLLLRVGFVLRYGGMDCASCQASPMLFLWYWMIETAILVPGLVAVFALWRAMRSTPAMRG